MELAKIEVTRADARKVHCDTLTAGMKGAEVTFSFDASWDGLNRIVTFKTGCAARDVLLAENCCEIPHEVLAEPCQHLMVGIYGTNADGTLVIPTVWADLGTVNRGAKPTGYASAKPTPEVWAQILGMIGDTNDLDTKTKESLVAAINEVRECGTTIPAATVDTLGGVKAEPATEDDTQPVRIGEDGMLFTAPGGGGAGGDAWELIADITFEEQVNSFSIDVDQKGNPFSLKKYLLAYVWEKITEGEQTSSYMYLIENNRQYGDNKPPLYTDAFEVAQLNSLVGGMIYNELLPNNIQWGQAWANNVQSSISVEPFRPIGSPMNNVMGKTVFKQHNDYLPFYQIGGKGAVMPKGSRVMLWGVRA